MRHTHLLAIVLGIIITALSSPALACSCMAYPSDEAAAVDMAWPEADAIFLGRVSSIKPGMPGLGRWTSVTFTISTAWKGIDDDSPVVVRTASNSAACGYPFKQGESYVVFAARRPQTDQLTTSLCSLNRQAHNAENLKRELDRAVRRESGAK